MLLREVNSIKFKKFIVYAMNSLIIEVPGAHAGNFNNARDGDG